MKNTATSHESSNNGDKDNNDRSTQQIVGSACIQYMPSSIKMETEEDLESQNSPSLLDDLIDFGPYIGEVVPPLASTPISSTPSAVSVASLNNSTAMSPIHAVAASPAVTGTSTRKTPRRTTKKQLFNSPNQTSIRSYLLPTQPTSQNSDTNSEMDITLPPPAQLYSTDDDGSSITQVQQFETPRKRKANNDNRVTGNQSAKRGKRNTRKQSDSTSTSIYPNDSGVSEFDCQDNDSSDSFGSDETETNERDTVDHLSIHRLRVDTLRERFENSSLNEVDLINKIMEEVNKDIKRRYKHDRSSFECWTDKTQKGTTSSSETFGFTIHPFVQRVEHHNRILMSLGVSGDSVKRVDINLIVFYCRDNDIYAFTTNHTWQAIQRYCCFDFPCLISGRLTNADGAVEEVTKPLAGNKRRSNVTKKNATLVDRLKNVTLNWTKEVRKSSSLFKLKEFQSSKSSSSEVQQSARGKLFMQFGLAYVRIKRRIDLKNLPEILDHFTKICRNEPTYTTGGREEKQIDEFPYIRPVDRKDMQEVEHSFYELLNKFMHNTHEDQIRKFDFVDKHINDFCNAENFVMFYEKPGFESHVFLGCPSALEVLMAVRTKYGNNLVANNDRGFQSNFKKIKIKFTIRGKNEYVERRVVDLIEGEMVLNGKEYWKIMGVWYSVSDEYHFHICKEFRDLLNKPGIFVENDGMLPKSWDKASIISVASYAKQYEHECLEKNYYFLPPSKKGTEEQQQQGTQQSSQESECDTSSEAASSVVILKEEPSRFFDLMCVRKLDKGDFAFSLFYIFDGFDSSIRDASTRIAKSIEVILRGETPRTSSKSPLERFWNFHEKRDKYFRAFFPEYGPFRQSLTVEHNVTIVVAFATEPRPLDTSLGPLDAFVTRPTTSSSDEVLTGTLEREKNLKLSINLDIVSEILSAIKDKDQSVIDDMCRELELEAFVDSENSEIMMELLTSKVLGMLSSNKYCIEEKQNSNATNNDLPVSGKLLRIRNASNFKLFRNNNANKLFFNAMLKYFITGFPGFVHKLECFQIYEDVSKEPRLNLNFIEIK